MLAIFIWNVTMVLLHYPAVVLASQSPRRRELLAQIDIPIHAVCATDIDETPFALEQPAVYSLRLAKSKALAVQEHYLDYPIIAADTVVSKGRRLLQKPQNSDEAYAMLRLLSGSRHRVYSSVVLLREQKMISRTVISHVAFKHLSSDEMETYIASGEWKDKAGGYAIQGKAAEFIRFIRGSYSNVVGLPLYETAQLLKSCYHRQSSL